MRARRRRRRAESAAPARLLLRPPDESAEIRIRCPDPGHGADARTTGQGGHEAFLDPRTVRILERAAGQPHLPPSAAISSPDRSGMRSPILSFSLSDAGCRSSVSPCRHPAVRSVLPRAQRRELPRRCGPSRPRNSRARADQPGRRPRNPPVWSPACNGRNADGAAIELELLLLPLGIAMPHAGALPRRAGAARAALLARRRRRSEVLTCGTLRHLGPDAEHRRCAASFPRHAKWPRAPRLDSSMTAADPDAGHARERELTQR